LESDYDTPAKSIVKRFLSYLWGSRRGLYLETELAVMLEEKGIEHHEWSSVYVALEDFLFSSSGLLNFSNRKLFLSGAALLSFSI
jgi:hypothetical protein